MDDLNLRTSDDWTPARGMIRGAIAGVVTAALLAVGANVLAWFAPGFAIDILVRNGAAVLTVWLLFNIVHGAAGMAGWGCTAMVVVLTLLVACAQHIAFAIHGGPVKLGTVGGWEWCSPPVLVAINVWMLPGIAFGVWMWRDGGSFGAVRDILRMKMH